MCLEPIKEIDGESLLLENLSRRRREVVELLAKSYSCRNIAARMGITVSTVRKHLDHLYTQTKTGDRLELIAYFYKFVPRKKGSRPEERSSLKAE